MQSEGVYRFREKEYSQEYDNGAASRKESYAKPTYGKEYSVPFDWVTDAIQSSRVDGVGSYNAYREICGWKRAKKFEDFYDLIKDNAVSASSLQVSNCLNDRDVFQKEFKTNGHFCSVILPVTS